MNICNSSIRVFVLAVAISFPAFGSAQTGLELSMQSFQEIISTAADGSQEKTLVPAARVLPGNDVIYVITYRNSGDKPIGNAVISNPLPAPVSYLPGSALGEGANFQVSVDGGKTFGVLISLKVTDGDGTERPARSSDVTHLRWAVTGSIAPGSEGSVSYRAVLK